MADFAEGADALIARLNRASGLRAHLMASYTMAEDVGLIATKADVGQLILNHLVPADDPTFTDKDWQDGIVALTLMRLQYCE